MDTLIGYLCLIGGAIIGGLLFEDTGVLIGLIIGGYIGYKINDQNADSRKPKSRIKKPTNTDDTLDQRTLRIGTERIVTYVVGVSFKNRQSVIANLEASELLYLEREHDNIHDKNAIKVLAPNKVEGNIEYTRNDAFRAAKAIGDPIQEYYVMNQIGYINRDLASQIAPIFDEYACWPNNFIKAKIVKFSKGLNKSTGVQIEFNLPTQNDLEHAILLSRNSAPIY